MSAALFYTLGAAAVAATAMAVTRRHMVHAVVYLVLSFFALGLIFFMMGAPLVAAVEVLVYAGAIMVLFLFIVMMLDVGTPVGAARPSWKAWGPAALITSVILISAALLFTAAPGSGLAPGAVFISPRAFGRALFEGQALAVEAVSLLLLFALVGSLYLGRRD